MPLHIIWWTQKSEIDEFLPAFQHITGSVMPDNVRLEINSY
jgi:hypothetical protein